VVIVEQYINIGPTIANRSENVQDNDLLVVPVRAVWPAFVLPEDIQYKFPNVDIRDDDSLIAAGTCFVVPTVWRPYIFFMSAAVGR